MLKISFLRLVSIKSYTHNRDILHRGIKPANVLVSSSHYKSYRHKELEMVFGKKPIHCKFGDLGEAKSMYTQTNALTGTNGTTTVHREILAFMVPDLIIVESSIASAETDELKTVYVWVVSMTLFTLLNPDQSDRFQHYLENIPNKGTSGMTSASKQ